MAHNSDGDHDRAELGFGGGGDADSAAGHCVCRMDRDWRGGYGGARHPVVRGVCGFEQASLPWADRYGNSRVETDWRITQHSAAENLRATYHIMKQVLFIVDVQPSFPISMEILHGIRELSAILPSVATVERHDESVTPFERQLAWKPGKADESLVLANRVFIKYGFLPPPAAIEYLRSLRVDRILVCGSQADTCVLAAGFALFDAGLHPTLLKWLTVGSSLDRSGDLGARLWEHHFGSVLKYSDQLDLPDFAK